MFTIRLGEKNFKKKPKMTRPTNVLVFSLVFTFYSTYGTHTFHKCSGKSGLLHGAVRQKFDVQFVRARMDVQG